jgi:AcrR family transcriptional regulator
MPRPDRSAERRLELAPLLARAFAELGYRRASTAELAARCAVHEKELFRLWPDKRALFLAALAQVVAESTAIWDRVGADAKSPAEAARRLLAYESVHHGEHRLYRIVFAGLSETDDPEIRDALAALYRGFHERVTREVGDPLAAWAILGLGTVANIGRELEILDARARARLFEQIGGALLPRARKESKRRRT